ncbi:hypothetical protein KIN20_030215 [Parelaphostrongylus tenuis]|uniref:Uncharacterized protein n=1 Tax=Parelaphostrongylus tenuis TaxID=148309 RepID=A0AAD5R3I0_PARTN|nr:hypothetical protein KIN20_030215 [Parelaphostrongylus tenuis]
MSNSRWSTDDNNTVTSSPAVSDTSDADITLRVGHNYDDAAVSSTFSNSTLYRPNRPPCLHRELRLAIK